MTVPDLPPVVPNVELNDAEVHAAVAALLSGHVADADKAAFLRNLRNRGETPGEIAAFARAMLERAVDPGVDPARLPGPLVDVCGTGGDRLDLFNVSTTVCFLLAAGGAAVAKHGGRNVSSRSGAVDVLAALGVPAAGVPPVVSRKNLETHGLCFLFAPDYHPAFAAGVAVRRQLAQEGISTVFNLLGPLLNPARPARQLVGVFAPGLTGTLAETFRRLGREHAWAVHGEIADGTGRGMDELSTLGETLVGGCDAGRVHLHRVSPEDAGLPRAGTLDDLRGGDPAANARIVHGILAGEIGGARRDLVLLNAAAGFCVAGLSADLGEGVERARRTLADGSALGKLRALQGTGAAG